MAKPNSPARVKSGIRRKDSAGAKPSSKEPRTGKPKRPPVEIGGPKGLDPTRYGDWERKGRCIDF